jgi:HK97 gp10 family phage protein
MARKPRVGRKPLFAATFGGVKELARAFGQIASKAFPAKALRIALRDAGKIVQKKARQIVAKRTGGLRKGIKVKALKSRGGRRAKVLIGPDQDHWYGLLVELGTGSRKVKKTGRSVGSMPKQPFMKPAFDQSQAEMQKAILNGLGKALLREAKKFARQARRGKLSRSARRALGG